MWFNTSQGSTLMRMQAVSGQTDLTLILLRSVLRAPNENIVQNHLNIALLNEF